MKNKKGFTLVELIGVILILAILLLITVPSIIEILSNSKTKEEEQLAHTLELAAETYVEQNRDLFPELDNAGNKVFIRVGTLKDAKFVTDSTKGVNDEEIDNFTIIASTGNDNIITYKYVNMDSDISGYVSNGLKALYDGYAPLYFDSTLLQWPDNSGNNNPGIIRNNTDSSIQSNGYIKLDGIDDFIELENANTLIGADGSYTIQMTYTIYQVPASEAYFKSRGLGLYYMDVSDTGVAMSMVRNTTDTANFWPAASVTDLGIMNMLHTLTVTVSKNGDNYDFQYYSGDVKLVMTSATGKKHYDTGTYYRIGIDYGATTSFINVHGFKMYNRVLTDDEIKSNYLIDKVRYEQ